MTDIDAAWLSGLLEGEGYFQITKPKPNHPTQVLIRLAMTDKDVVEKASKLLNVPINCKAKTTEKTATIIVRRCTSDHSGQVTFVFNSSNASDI